MRDHSLLLHRNAALEVEDREGREVGGAGEVVEDQGEGRHQLLEIERTDAESCSSKRTSDRFFDNYSTTTNIE